MKEMVYAGKTAFEVLGQGDVDGYTWAVVSHGAHPSVYVAPPEGHPATGLYRNFRWTSLDLTLNVHGGITYARFGLFEVDPKGARFWLGWDYNHGADFANFGNGVSWGKRKYSAEELRADAEDAIRQLKKLEGMNKWKD